MNKIKSKAFVALLVVAMLVAQTVLPSFAADTAAENVYECNGKVVHKVKESELPKQALTTEMPTCIADGYTTYKCPMEGCDGNVVVTLPATGNHIGDKDDIVGGSTKGMRGGVKVTCTTDGKKPYQQCKFCKAFLDENGVLIGTTEADLVIPKTGHNFVVNRTVEAKCETDGYTEYKCKNSGCNETKKDDIVEALGHKFDRVIEEKAPTCVEPGYYSYTVCSRCGKEDPANPKVVRDVEDHNLKVTTVEPTCTEDGKREFKCENEACTYFTPKTEVLPALGHNYLSHEATDATCTEDGSIEYKECVRCNKYFVEDTTADEPVMNEVSKEDTVVKALGHKPVNAGYKAPTCTADGSTGDIVCRVCNETLSKGKVIKKIKHTFGETIQAKEATCEESGYKAHTECSVCGNYGDANGKYEVAKDKIILPPTGHNFRETIKDATCTEEGYIIKTCDNKGCDKTVSTILNPIGHEFKLVAEVAPKCEETGTKEHLECAKCEGKFALNAGEYATEQVSDEELAIPATGHDNEEVAEVLPTYTTSGNTAGTRCKVCGKFTGGADFIPALRQSIRFYTVIEGVNGAATAVNSGYIKVKVYFDVLKDELDTRELEAIAQMFGADLKISYDNTAFKYTEAPETGSLFPHFTYTPEKIANDNGYIIIQCDMDKEVTGYTFTGTGNLLTTLTFQVGQKIDAGNYDFVLGTIKEGLDSAVTGGLKDAALEEKYDIASEFVTGTVTVEKLGDSNGDGFFTTADVLELSKYLETADLDTEYIAKFDLNKDGYITFEDLDLLRKAIVGNNEYLDIIVDPNAPAQD